MGLNKNGLDTRKLTVLLKQVSSFNHKNETANKPIRKLTGPQVSRPACIIFSGICRDYIDVYEDNLSAG